MRSIFYNGAVYTSGGLPADAFAVEDGRFIAVGTESGVLPLAREGDALVDLHGQFVCPGFNDSHMHLLSYGYALGMAQLAPHTDSLARMLAYVRDFAAAHPVRGGQWLLGRGWNQDYFTDVRRMPDRHDLDSVSRDVPVMLTRACGHCCVVNSRVLEIAGITGDTPSPEGGAVGMEDGLPDGRLYDNAMDLLTPFLPLPGVEELKEMIRRGCAGLNRYGVTSAQSDDYCLFRSLPWETVNRAYRELEESGELTVRVYEQANFTVPEDLSAFMAAGNVTGAGSDLFKIGPLKMLGDGSLGSRTAHLSRPYADAPGTSGFSLFSAEHMDAMVSLAHERGMQIAIHAIGDACLDQVLAAVGRALEAHPRPDHRHGVVHCQISRAEQLRRIAELGLHVYAQSIFLDYDNHMAADRVGPELAATSYCWKTLMDAGVSVSNGSDCPVELPDVMEGMECAVTRTSLDGTGPYLPEEAFTVAEALDSFTIRGAEASFEEDRKGRIAPGYLADFTVLGADPFAVEPREIHAIPVRETWLGGVRVYAAEGDKA